VPTSANDRFRFFDTLVATEIAMWSAVDAAVSKTSAISLGLLMALRRIDDADGRARVQEVADGIGVTVGAASKVVDRLERAGLVRRVPNPNDRRSSLLEMTESGGAVLGSGLRSVRAELARRTDILTPEQLAVATEHLDALRRGFSEQPD
jgi:DNA-binding MarR family transcriptional regulator